MSEPLFEIITEDEFRRDNVQRTARTIETEPRTLTVWMTLPTHMGFCACPDHDEVQKLLNPTQKEYRQKYPTRMIYEIKPGMAICRDCFVAEADKDG